MFFSCVLCIPNQLKKYNGVVNRKKIICLGITYITKNYGGSKNEIKLMVNKWTKMKMLQFDHLPTFSGTFLPKS